MISTGHAIVRKRSHMPKKPCASRRMERSALSASSLSSRPLPVLPFRLKREERKGRGALWASSLIRLL
jgi:hypothetical protein